jgi:hypothetical protein
MAMVYRSDENGGASAANANGGKPAKRPRSEDSFRDPTFFMDFTAKTRQEDKTYVSAPLAINAVLSLRSRHSLPSITISLFYILLISPLGKISSQGSWRTWYSTLVVTTEEKQVRCLANHNLRLQSISLFAAKKPKGKLQWDRRKKKYVTVSGSGDINTSSLLKRKKILNESGKPISEVMIGFQCFSISFGLILACVGLGFCGLIFCISAIPHIAVPGMAEANQAEDSVGG